MTTLLVNGNHKHVIEKNMTSADEVVICTAFFKKSSLSKSILKNARRLKKKMTMFVGIDFFQTEPDALQKMRSLGINLFIVHSSELSVTFHPKLYLFKNSEAAFAIIGSANMTKGGLETNYELSSCISVKNGSIIENELSSYIESLKNDENSSRCTNVELKKYRDEYEKFHRNDGVVSIVRNQSQKEKNKVFVDLQKYLHIYKKRSNSELLNRLKDYKKACNILKNQNLNIEQFKKALNHFPSGLMYARQKFKHQISKIRKLIQCIRFDCNKGYSSEDIFDRNYQSMKKISGVGTSIFTDLMTAFKPCENIVLNSRVIEVINQMGISLLKSSAPSYTPEDYKEFCATIRFLQDKWGLSCTAEVDLFLSLYKDNMLTKE